MQELQSESTRDRVLGIIKKEGEVTVKALTK